MIKTNLKIDGMACPMCETHIVEVIRKAVPGAKKVSASYKRGKASFLTAEAVEEKHLRDAITATGYICTEITTEPYEKRGWFR